MYSIFNDDRRSISKSALLFRGENAAKCGVYDLRMCQNTMF